jgi:hypothetical protein
MFLQGRRPGQRLPDLLIRLFKDRKNLVHHRLVVANKIFDEPREAKG